MKIYANALQLYCFNDYHCTVAMKQRNKNTRKMANAKLKKPRTLKDLKQDPRVYSIHKEPSDVGFTWWCYLNEEFEMCHGGQTITGESLSYICHEVHNSEKVSI